MKKTVTELNTQGIYARKALIAENRKRNRLNSNFKCNEDTIIRTEIHGIIVSGVDEGKTIEEIKQNLNIERYQKYSDFFENWITDRIKKDVVRQEKQK